jgi:hypothetical protein
MKHLIYSLEQKLGTGFLRTTPIELCLTVPAIWSEIAKEKTLKASQKAGLNPASEILLVSEPVSNAYEFAITYNQLKHIQEAAAIYSLHNLNPHGLAIGETFVVCDAGGGTVDLISYTITELHPVLKLKEVVPGTGALCGSMFLNRHFEQLLKSKMDNQPGWDDEAFSVAMERFDRVVSQLEVMYDAF